MFAFINMCHLTCSAVNRKQEMNSVVFTLVLAPMFPLIIKMIIQDKRTHRLVAEYVLACVYVDMCVFTVYQPDSLNKVTC